MLGVFPSHFFCSYNKSEMVVFPMFLTLKHTYPIGHFGPVCFRKILSFLSLILVVFLVFFNFIFWHRTSLNGSTVHKCNQLFVLQIVIPINDEKKEANGYDDGLLPCTCGTDLFNDRSTSCLTGPYVIISVNWHCQNGVQVIWNEALICLIREGGDFHNKGEKLFVKSNVKPSR